MVRAVNPVVQRAEQTVRRVFGSSARAEFRVGFGRVVVCHERFFVTLQVAVRVATKPEVWRFGHERAAAHERQRARHHEAVEEHCPLVHSAIAVSVFENDHIAHLVGFADAINVWHVAAHLDHPDSAIGIERDLNRVMHQRLDSDQFEAETGLEFE